MGRYKVTKFLSSAFVIWVALKGKNRSKNYIWTSYYSEICRAWLIIIWSRHHCTQNKLKSIVSTSRWRWMWILIIAVAHWLATNCIRPHLGSLRLISYSYFHPNSCDPQWLCHCSPNSALLLAVNLFQWRSKGVGEGCGPPPGNTFCFRLRGGSGKYVFSSFFGSRKNWLKVATKSGFTPGSKSYSWAIDLFCPFAVSRKIEARLSAL